jgi:hypothetical protein
MDYIISEYQYKLILEQELNDNWLYDWFKSVPENKIKNTFSFIGVNFFQKFITNKSTKIPTPLSFSKYEILNLLSKKPKINVVDKNTFELMGQLITDVGILYGFYIDEKFKEVGSELLSSILQIEKDYKKYEGDPNINDKFKEIETTKKIINLIIQYAGSIVVPNDLKNKIKNSGLSVKDVTRHEEMHVLYDNTLDHADEVIRGLCSNSKCNGKKFDYVKKSTEIYSFLMTLRSKMNLSPIDVIKSSKIIKGHSQSEIVLTIDRDGKTIILRDYLPNNSTVLKAMECCTGDIGNSIKILHNTLAKNTPLKNKNEMV